MMPSSVNTTPGAAASNSGPAQGIQKGSHVTLHFRLTLGDGNLVFDTFTDKPATIQVGEGQVAPALERCLIALKEGDERSYELASDDGFGRATRSLCRKLVSH